jgi:hypothetical protein
MIPASGSLVSDSLVSLTSFCSVLKLLMYSVGTDDGMTQTNSELDDNFAEDNSSDIDKLDEDFFESSKHKSLSAKDPDLDYPPTPKAEPEPWGYATSGTSPRINIRPVNRHGTHPC